MSEGVLALIKRSCDELKRKFDDSCAYRTCHYRHTVLSNSLALASHVAAELNGESEGSAVDEYKAIMAFAWSFSEALRDHRGDARLYGALRETEELAARLVRDAWFKEHPVEENCRVRRKEDGFDGAAAREEQ